LSEAPDISDAVDGPAHDHHRAPVIHAGPQPVAYTLQADLRFADAASYPSEELVERLREFLSGLLSALRDGGCTLIGHVKGMVDADDLGRVFFSVTSFRGSPHVTGAIGGSLGSCRLTLNVIVFGIEEPAIATAVREAMRLHLAPWQARGKRLRGAR
jgi:hypothetical protein